MSHTRAFHASKGPNRRDDWSTPQWLFDRLNDEFGFDLDAAASDGNAKCERYLTDALNGQPWPGERIWLNPPYQREIIERFLRRAHIEAESGKTVVVLLPVRSEMAWWHELVLPKATEIRFVRGRVSFRPPPGHVTSEAGNRPVFASAVAVFRRSRGHTRLGSIFAPRSHRNLVAGQRELECVR